MKKGDLVRTVSGRLGIVKAYYKNFDAGTSYPWYVYMPDNHWRVEYFQTDQLELVSESR
jgi:hypothetical protein